MTNKCSNCGFEYGEYDVYCSRCGQKIDNNPNIQKAAELVYENLINNEDSDILSGKKKFEFFQRNDNYKANIFDAFVVLFTIATVLTILLIILANKHTNAKEYLEYKNLISKPASIPLLKNLDYVEDFSLNLKRNERFLKLYLKFSQDDNEQKEKIFTNYLVELNKLENITNENLLSVKYPECEKIKDSKTANKCFKYYTEELKNTSAKPHLNNKVIYLYPDKKFIKKTYLKYVTSDMKQFIILESKFKKQTFHDGTLLQKPSYVFNKISKYEQNLNNETNKNIKELTEQTLYNDVKNIVFARTMYATTTHEMQPLFKKSFESFVRWNKYSLLKPLFLDYLDKQKTYTQDNFVKDYPYKIFDETFDDNVQNSIFKDIFAQLRKNYALNSESVNFAYVYNLMNSKWTRYKSGMELNEHNYIISYPDDDNNVTFYNFAFSPIQEMNILDNSSLFINSGQIYIYNYDKLAYYKITYNGKLFNTKTLNYSDVSSIFPGVNIINLDSTNNYDIYVEKENKNANFVILSRYSQGLKNYEITVTKGEIKKMTLSNMFSVNTNDEVVVLFHDKDSKNPDDENQSPAYRIFIKTLGHSKPRYEEQDNSENMGEDKVEVNDEEDVEPHTPTIKPKITTDENDALILPPSKQLEPMTDDD